MARPIRLATLDEIVIASSNPHKLAELLAIFGSLDVEGVSLVSLNSVAPGLSAPDETAETFAENARIKAIYYAQRAGMPCLADDSGLCVDALGGSPGIHSSRYAASDRERIDRLLTELTAAGATSPENRTARFVCAACLALPGGRIAEAQGECEGLIANKPSGKSGFGYDPIFFLSELGLTMAQLTAEEKNSLSHRFHAMSALVEIINIPR